MAVARQTPLSKRFSRQGYCSKLPFPSQGDLPDPGMEPGSPALQADSLLLEHNPQVSSQVPIWKVLAFASSQLSL